MILKISIWELGSWFEKILFTNVIIIWSIVFIIVFSNDLQSQQLLNNVLKLN